jgi:hypothetical protein
MNAPFFAARPSADRSSRAVAAALTLVLAVTIAVRVSDPTGWLGSDDAAYHSAAEHVLTGTPIQRLHHHYARMAVVVPIAASMEIFGNTALAVALPSHVASIACVLLVVILGRRLWGWSEGLIAGTIVAVLPYFRVLSTTAYPDVHVCLWTTASMLLAFAAAKSASRRRSLVLWILAGLAFGLAVSAKVFAIAVLAGITVVMIRHGRGVDRLVPVFLRAFVPFLCGGLALQLLDGLFYLWAAGDFFFSLRATLSASDNVPSIASEAPSQAGLLAFAWDRFMLFHYPARSGWGVIAIPFWGMLAVGALFDRQARVLAAWGLAAFALVAFAPVSFKGGPQAYPIFHGRHILPACVPFALCLAWCLCRGAEVTLSPKWQRRALPLGLAAIVPLAYVERRALNGFCDRQTSRVGLAIAQMIPSIPDDKREIFMTPSMYWRFRVLFPTQMRDRLRVAAAADSPSWWKQTCVGITDRERPLSGPDAAYLIATPRQLAGEAEQWEYGVGLPTAELDAWRAAEPLTTFVRHADKRIGPPVEGRTFRETVLVVAGETVDRTKTVPDRPQARFHTDR